MIDTVSGEELDAGRGYESLFVPALFAPWTHHLVERAQVGPGNKVLDVACGTGVLARHTATVVGGADLVSGVDPAPGMIAAAKEVSPSIDWHLGTAEALPFPDNSFDRVVSQFGIMFFQDRADALSEMFRVLKPGGRLAIAAWHGLDRNPTYRDMVGLMEREVGTDAANAVTVPFCLGEADDVVDLVLQAGFDDVSTVSKTETATFPSTRTVVEVEARGWLPLFDIHLTDTEIADLLQKSDPVLSKYANEAGEAVFRTSAHITSGRKPL